MTNPLPIPDELWAKVPSEAQAAIAAAFAAMHQRIAELEAKVRDLETRLTLNSTNSSKPPSSDPIGLKRKPPAPASQRRRGGQPGHARQQRALVAPEKVASVTDCKPAACRRCAHPLDGTDSEPLIHQVADLPPIEPIVAEYRLHRLSCPQCGETTCGRLPDGVPSGCFRPRLHALLCVLAGAYRLSKRQIQQLVGDVLGLSISTGMICKLERQAAATLAGPVEELAAHIHQAPAVHIDETGWREDKQKAWLWVVLTPLVTVFHIIRSRAAAVAQRLLGSRAGQVVHSDRYPGYDWIDPNERQVCWAHLRRDFQAMIDRGGAAAEIGQRLLWASNKLYEWWHKVRDGTIQPTTFQSSIGGLKTIVRETLRQGSACACPKTAATCHEILKIEPSLWAFARLEGVEPDNNVAERAERHAVIWRRTRGGTDSEQGSRFVERVLSVVATCRQQKRDVLGYLTSCFHARLIGQPIPSLLPQDKSEIKVA